MKDSSRCIIINLFVFSIKVIQIDAIRSTETCRLAFISSLSCSSREESEKYFSFTNKVSAALDTKFSGLWVSAKNGFKTWYEWGSFCESSREPSKNRENLQIFRFISSRSTRMQMFCEIDVLNNFVKFTGKHLCRSLFSKLTGVFLWFLRDFKEQLFYTSGWLPLHQYQ